MLLANKSTDETTESLEKRAAESIAADSSDDIPEPRSITYKDYDDPFTLVNQASGAPQIAKMSANAWVGCGGDIYVLECLGKGHVRIEPVESACDSLVFESYRHASDKGEDGQHYRAYFNPALDSATAAALKIGPFLRSRQILTATNLNDAVHGCDTYVRSKVVRGPMQLGQVLLLRPRDLNQI